VSILQGRSAIVTGAATGIGRSIALCLAQHGARLVIGDIQAADETVRLAAENGARADFVPCDVTDEIAIRNFVEQAIRLCDGRIDILVNSAGINGECQLVQDMSLQRWERTLRVNLTGTMLVAREVIPIMIKRGTGRIVNVASNVARRGLPFRGDYVCSKWAVLGLTQTLALELAQHGIRVNAVCPGPVEGERIEDILRAHAAAERRTMAEVRQSWAAGSPMNRFIDPTEVADVVLFLCSDLSRAMTGQALNVTAGMLMT